MLRRSASMPDGASEVNLECRNEGRRSTQSAGPATGKDDGEGDEVLLPSGKCNLYLLQYLLLQYHNSLISQ